MIETDLRARISSALDQLPWLSRGCRELILETRWEALSPEEVAEYHDHVIPLVVRLVDRCSSESPVFADTVREAAANSRVQASVPSDDVLVADLLGGRINHDNCLAVFSFSLLVIPTSLKEDPSLYDLPHARRRITAMIVGDLYAQHGAIADCLQSYSRLLGLDLSSLDSPNRLTDWLRQNTPHPLDFRSLPFLASLAHRLTDARKYSLAAIVGRYFFDEDYEGHSRRPFSPSFARRFDRLVAEENALLPGDEQGRTLFHLSVTQTARVVNRLYLSLKTLDSSTNSTDAAPASTPRDSDEILDAIFAYHQEIERLDFRYFDLLCRVNPAQYVLPLANEWVRSLERRRLLDHLADQFARDTQESACEWWSHPDSTGRIYVVNYLIERAFCCFTCEGVLEFLIRVLQPGESTQSPNDVTSITAEIGAILAGAPHPEARAAANLLTFSIAIQMSERGHSPLIMLENFLGFTTPSYFASRDFIKYIGRMLDNPSFNMRDARNLASLNVLLLCQAALTDGHVLKGSTTAIAIVRSIVNDDASVARFFNVLADVSSSFLQVVTFALEVASEFHPRLAGVALRGIEQYLGLADLRRDDPEALKERIAEYCRRLATSKSDEMAKVIGLSCATRILAQLGDVSRAIILVNALKETPWKSDEESNCIQAIAACQMIDSLVHIRDFDKVLKLTDSLPTMAPGGVTIVVPQLPNHPAVHRLLVSRVAPKLAAARLTALRRCNRGEEARQAVEREYPARHWEATQHEFSPIDLCLARECASVMCHHDQEYLFSVLDLYYRHLPSLIDWVSGTVTAFEAAASDEVRHSFIRLGATAAVAALASEAAEIRLRHALVEAALSHRQIIVALNEPRLKPSDAAETGFRRFDHPSSFVARTSSNRPPSLLLAGDEMPVVNLDNPEFQRDWIHPALIRWAHNEEERLLNMVATSADSIVAGFSEEMLAAVIGDGKLLRLSVTLDERITWTILRVREGKVEVAAFDPRRGTPNDLRQVRAAIQLFERRLDWIWFALCQHKEEQLNALLRRLFLDSEQGAFRDVHDFAFASGEDCVLDAFPRIRERVRREFGDFMQRSHHLPEQASWEKWWRETMLLDWRGESSAWFRNQAAKEFVRQVGQVISAADIAAHLSEDDELIVWPDDDLFGIPFAMLEYPTTEGSRFLFERVETVRTIVSPLVDDRLRADWVAQPSNSRVAMVTVSHLGGTRQSALERLMYREFDKIRQETDQRLEMWEASEDDGRGKVISKWLSDPGDVRIALMAIMGHGERIPQGVRLADGTWDGSAIYIAREDGTWDAVATTDLRNVDFWLQVSCSIGRLSQNGLHDATGFCVNLFRSRAQAVLAGRWTLHAQEGIRFARDVARYYLASYPPAHQPAEALWKSRIRSRAVAQARKQWAETQRARGKSDELGYGIDTVANMDYYGLG